MTFDAAHRHRPVLRGDRQRERDHRPRATGHDRATRAGELVVRRRALPLPGLARRGAATCSTASTSCSSPARPWRSSASPASGKTTLTALTTRLYDVTGGADARSTASTSAHCHREELRTHIAMAFEDATLFSRLGAGQRAARPAGARATSRGARRGRAVLAEALEIAQAGVRLRPAGRRGHHGRRGGPEPVRRAAAAPRAGPRGRGAARRCSCSTTRSRRWTSTPRRWSRPRCAACSPSTTALIVAHRPSTVQLADRVALLEDGRITAVGTPLRTAARPASTTAS